MPTIKLHEQTINYTVKKSPKAKRLKLTVNARAEVVLTVPRLVPVMFAETFLRSKAGWLLTALAKLESLPTMPWSGHSRSDYLQHKDAARQLVTERLVYFNQFYSFKYSRIFIKNQQTKWGSCSTGRNLNFNYRLALLPSELADYIVVHELCHLREMNHSSKFWQLLATALPDYQTRRRALKQYKIY